MWVNGWLASNFLIGATDKSSEEITGMRFIQAEDAFLLLFDYY